MHDWAHPLDAASEVLLAASSLEDDIERVNHVGDWGTQFGMLIETSWKRAS